MTRLRQDSQFSDEANPKGLIILDRDGVINELCIDPEHGLIDSPLNVSQVNVFQWVSKAISDLCRQGFHVAIATNQPAFAKGKTTLENLKEVHAKIVEIAEKSGGKIASSHICWHRNEDNCECRKPKPTLLLDALEKYTPLIRKNSWMVGDSYTDIQAGIAAGLQTAFLGPKKCDMCKLLTLKETRPTLWCSNLSDFVNIISNET